MFSGHHIAMGSSTDPRPLGFPPGHFYSPIPDFDEIERRRAQIWPEPPPMPPGVDFRISAQLRLLRRLRRRAPVYPYGPGDDAPPAARFRDENPRFSGLDARLYHGILHLHRPRRVVEIGSGHSTRLLLDTRDADPRIAREVTVIDPYPESEIRAALATAPGVSLLERPAQEVGFAPFTALAKGDLLFVDSSHVVRIGSDVQFLLLELLPRLPRGVLIQFHDLFLPADYPPDWVLGEGRAWNEQYVLQAQLQFSRTLRILASSAFLHARAPARVLETFGRPVSGGSLWMKRVGPVAPFPGARRAGRFVPPLAVALGLGLAELVTRSAIGPRPSPALHRIDYSLPGATDDARRAMSSTWAWWVSEPDGAAFPRWLGDHGFRGERWPIPRSPGIERTVILGDSFVEGLGAPDGATIPEAFAAAFAALGRPVEALNLGVSGAGFPEYLPLLRDALDRLAPRRAVLVVYDNDFGLPLPDPDAALARISPPPRKHVPSWLRLADLFHLARSGAKVPWRWRPPLPTSPRPLDAAGRLRDDPRLDERIRAVARADLRSAMRSGRLSPVVVDHLDRSLRGLPLAIEPFAVLARARELAAGSGVELRVAYLPTLNQVSDAYLPQQRAISPSLRSEVLSLRSVEYQRHAADLGAACRRLGVPFLDLTTPLATAEQSGLRLYWGFDGHMRAAGYLLVGELLAAWTASASTSATADSPTHGEDPR